VLRQKLVRVKVKIAFMQPAVMGYCVRARTSQGFTDFPDIVEKLACEEIGL